MDLIREEDKRGQKRRVPLKVCGGKDIGIRGRGESVGKDSREVIV